MGSKRATWLKRLFPVERETPVMKQINFPDEKSKNIIEELKAEAHNLRNQTGLRLHEALNLCAQKRGFDTYQKLYNELIHNGLKVEGKA